MLVSKSLRLWVSIEELDVAFMQARSIKWTHQKQYNACRHDRR